jgi:hypothetical protein
MLKDIHHAKLSVMTVPAHTVDMVGAQVSETNYIYLCSAETVNWVTDRGRTGSAIFRGIPALNSVPSWT